MPANDDLVRGWVSTDCGRGTSDILWSCLTTIFLCVWTAIHLPVPLYHGRRPLSKRQKLVRSGIGPALISVIAPEFLAITAIYDLVISWVGEKEIKRLTQIDLTLTHQFFLDMGGVCLTSPSGRHLQIGREEVIRVVEASRNQGKQTMDPPDWVSELEKLTEDQIKNLAKSDTLSKLIACGQSLWLVTQVVSRVCQHRAITLLEISTCAYVSCALLSYAAWWKKPQGCTSPIMITCSDDAVSEIVNFSPLPNYYTTETWKEYVWAGRHWLSNTEFSSNGFQILGNFEVGLAVLCPTLFGAIHVASWYIRLPSDAELWMWRGSSIYCLISGLPFAMLLLFVPSGKLPSWITSFLLLNYVLLPVLYIIVRIYMIVELFLSLRALPPSAFESVQWSSFIPHV